MITTASQRGSVCHQNGFLQNVQMGSAAKRNVGTGSGQIPDMSSFTLFSSGTSGYMTIPPNRILQWGEIGVSTGDIITNFPIPFPNRCLRAFVTQSYTPTSGAIAYISGAAISRSQLVSRCSSSGLGGSFWAIGD